MSVRWKHDLHVGMYQLSNFDYHGESFGNLYILFLKSMMHVYVVVAAASAGRGKPGLNLHASEYSDKRKGAHALKSQVA